MSTTLLERRLDDVEETTGSGTALVSLYIAADKNITSVQTRMSQEKSEAANIKSDQNRKNVESAIDRVNTILKQYAETPENGLVVFAGVTNDDVVDFVFDELESPLDYSDYTCDSKFHTDPLREQVAPDHTIGLAVIERGGSAIGELRGTQVVVHKSEESNVMGKHNAGGQSAVRFDRLIEEQKDAFFNSVQEDLKSFFIDENNQPTIDGFVIGGTQVTVDNFISDGFLPRPLQDIQVGGSYAVDIANEQSLEQLVERAQDEIATVVEQDEREAMNKFFRALHSDDVHATYGDEKVEKALQYGAVDKLLVSENVPRETIVEYTEEVENQGGELVVVSDNFTEGEQFWNAFGGIGALLRYQID